MYRRDPNGNKIGMNSEKAFMKNYDTFSKLVIKNIQISDSGIYQLFAENRVHKKNISVTLLVEGNNLVKTIIWSVWKNNKHVIFGLIISKNTVYDTDLYDPFSFTLLVPISKLLKIKLSSDTIYVGSKIKNNNLPKVKNYGVRLNNYQRTKLKG